MIEVAIFFAKAFVVGGTLFFVVMGLLNLLFVLIATFFFRRARESSNIVKNLLNLFYIYFYFAFGSFYSSLADTYGREGFAKWFALIICFIALCGWVRNAQNSAVQSQIDMDNLAESDDNIYNEKFYQNSITISGLNASYFSILSFIFFWFKPDWIVNFFGNGPSWLASLFH